MNSRRLLSAVNSLLLVLFEYWKEQYQDISGGGREKGVWGGGGLGGLRGKEVVGKNNKKKRAEKD